MLNAKTLNIGFIGDYQSGKSLLVNCLLKRPIATVGDGNATTHTIIKYQFSQVEHIEYIEGGKRLIARLSEIEKLDTNPNINNIDVYVNCELLKNFSLIDMPGLDFDSNDDETSISNLASIDYAIVIAKNVHTISNYDQALYWLKIIDIPYYFIINCTTLYDDSRWNPNHRDNIDIARKDFEYLANYKPLTYPFDNAHIPIVNFLWYWLSFNHMSSDKLLQKYVMNFRNYGLLDDDITKADIEDESNFKLIKNIFSMDNKMYLELRKDLKAEIQKLKDDLCPIGTIQAFAFQNIPTDGWLFCNGSQYHIEEYLELYSKIGNVFDKDNTPDGFFCVPNLQGQFIRGWDMEGKTDKGHEFGISQEDALQGHRHTINESKVVIEHSGNHTHKVPNFTWDRPGKWGSYDSCEVSTAGSFSNDVRTATDGSHSHSIKFEDDFISEVSSSNRNNVRIANETRPKNVALLYCIKAK